MIRLKIEDIFQIPNRGFVISVRGDCSKIRIGGILVYPDGKEVRIDGIGMVTKCFGFQEDTWDLLVKDDIDPEVTTIYLKE